MWSQVEIVYSYIDRKDKAAADPAFEKLLALFAEQPTLPKEIHQIAMKYSGSGQGEKAYSLHQYNVEHFPDYNGLDVIWSQSELVRLDLQEGRYESACAGADKLLGWPPDQNDLPREIHVTAKRFAEAGKRDKASELYLYNVDHFPKETYAMWSQVEIAYANISGGDVAAADAACDKLLSLFSDQQSLPKEVYQVAGAYNKAKRSDKAAELCRYVVEKWPKSDHALWAQRDLAMWSIDANDEFAAQAAVDKLLSDFSEHQSITQVIHAVAQHYERAKGNLEKALELHRYNAEHFSSDVYAMWSQVEIVYFHIRDGNDAAADDAFDKLITVFADQPTLPKEIYQVGDQYAKARNFDKAGALYRDVIANWPGTEYEMWARTGNVRIDILAGDQTAVEPAVDALIADFNDHPDLPQAVFGIGEEYYYMAFVDPNKCQTVKSEEDLKKAKAVWEKVIAQCPQSKSIGLQHAHYFSAVCYRKLGKYDKAVSYYEKVIDKWPRYQFAWSAQCLIGECYEKLRSSGKLEESEATPRIMQAYKAVIEKYPDCSLVGHACLKLGNMNFEASQWDEAAMYFGLFLEKCPNDIQQTSALYHLGKTYEKMGESDTAMEVYRMFLEGADSGDYRIATVRANLDKLGGQK
jgi:tetratricopeptide (TPR) repeat protein